MDFLNFESSIFHAIFSTIFQVYRAVHNRNLRQESIPSPYFHNMDNQMGSLCVFITNEIENLGYCGIVHTCEVLIVIFIPQKILKLNDFKSWGSKPCN